MTRTMDGGGAAGGAAVVQLDSSGAARSVHATEKIVRAPPRFVLLVARHVTNLEMGAHPSSCVQPSHTLEDCSTTTAGPQRARDRHSRATVRAIVLVATACVAAPAAAAAQARTNAVLTGTVRDASTAVLPGATMTLESPNLIGGTQVVVTDGEGVYRFPSLLPGLYTLTAELAGFRSIQRPDIRLPIGTTVTVDLDLEVASVQETVVVRAPAPVVDVRSSASNLQLDDELLQSLPTGRFQPDMINLAPGVTNSIAFGGTQCSNALLIDGVDVSDPAAGAPWSFFNYNWIGEVQVVSLGAPAEYGEFTGAAANSIVRSGSNAWSGLLEYWTVRSNWLADNTGDVDPDLRETFTPPRIDTNYDTTAQIGGPIVKDRLWFFTGFQYYREVSTPAGFTGGFESERDPRFIAKMNWAPGQTVRVEGFFQKDKFDLTGRGASPIRPPETTIVEPSPGMNWNGRVTWAIDAHTLLDVRNGGFDGYFPLEPAPPNSREGPAPRFDGLTGLYSVNAPYYSRSDRNRNVTAVTLTRYVDQWMGKNHEFKFGLEFERSKVRDEFGYPGDVLYYDYGGAPYLAYLWDGYITEGTGRRTSVYAQDSWTVTDRVTINPGVRIGFDRGSVPATGTVFSTNPVSARIGVAWDVGADHRTVVRAHYGRYHDALFGATFQFMDFTNQNPFVTALVLADGGCAAGLGPACLELTRFEPEGNFAIDDEITHSYVDQFLIGIEREVLPDFSLRAQLVRRHFDNFFAFVDTGSRYTPVERPDPGEDGLLGTADDGGLLTVFDLLNPGEGSLLLTNPDDASRRYTAVQLIAAKRYSRNWQLNASYTWSRSTGVVNNNFGSNAGGGNGFETLGPTGIYANPNRFINQEGNSLFDYTHQAKIEATYRIPVWSGITTSGIYRYTTGLAWGRRAVIRDLTQGPENVRIEPRGTRRTDAINRLDLRVEKTVPIPSTRGEMGVFFDVFNLTNQGAIENAARTGVIETSGETFGDPNVWVQPRTVRGGVRFEF